MIVAREEKELRRIEGIIGESFVPVLDEKVLKDDVYLWVFSGQRPSTGYELLIVRAFRKESPARLCLEVRDITPDVSGWGSDPALTFPYALISIPRKEWPEAVEVVDGRGHPWKASLHKDFQAP